MRNNPTPAPLTATPAMFAMPALVERACAARPALAEGSTLPVPSPCISVCTLTPDRALCVGCWRTLDDIRIWAQADAAQRRAIWWQLLARAGLERTP